MPIGPLPRHDLSLYLTAMGLVGLVCASLIGADVYHCWNAREIVLRDARESTANLSRSLAQQAEDTFLATDSVLTSLRERIETDGMGPEALARIGNVMRMHVSNLPYLHSLSAEDEAGNGILGTLPGKVAKLNYADRDYFRHHLASANDAPWIDRPVRSKLDDTWNISVTRRLRKADGSFGGVLLAFIPVDLFKKLYQSFDLGRQGGVNLLDDRGRILVRNPFDPADIGRDISGLEPFREFQTSGDSFGIEWNSKILGKSRIGSIVRVPGLHLLIIVSRDKEEVLAPWWQETLRHLMWLVVVVTTVAALGLRVVYQIRERVGAERLYRLLADNSGDAILRLGLDGERRYASPSFWSLLGQSEREFGDRPWLDAVASEDRPSLEAAFVALAAGGTVTSCRFRFVRPDGQRGWAEMRARIAPAVDGTPVEIIANIRDIAEQKQAEDALARVNSELEAICHTDALTAIANRRYFDHVLASEWNRAMRSGSAVTLLMIDVDCFKAYNDLQGHVRGDECLRTISAVLQRTIRRAGDVLARYGGEEFAVLAPQLNAAAAIPLAETIRLAVSAEALPHPASPTGYVSVSIGAATRVPEPGSRPEALIEAADRALYAAKAGGRNRVVAAESLTGTNIRAA